MNAFQFRQMPLFIIFEETEVGENEVHLIQWCISWNGYTELLQVFVVKGD